MVVLLDGLPQKVSQNGGIFVEEIGAHHTEADSPKRAFATNPTNWHKEAFVEFVAAFQRSQSVV
jgi:hypothetical protein